MAPGFKRGGRFEKSRQTSREFPTKGNKVLRKSGTVERGALIWKTEGLEKMY